MCGICGIVGLYHRKKVDKALIERMCNSIRHRGPDGQGIYIKGPAGLGHLRLAIIDLATGSQPMANEDESLWIVLNGEIYNFLELRQELIQRGHRFRTFSDTECILHLYEEYRENCLSKLRGMFSFAIWDERAHRLFIARDRLGKKPLYYAEWNGSLYFCSELPGLLQTLRSQGFHPQVSINAIDLYLSLQYIPEPFTPFDNIHKLPAAHSLTYDDHGLHLDRYWQLHYYPKWTEPENLLAEELKQRVREAVQLRLVSEVPLGAHLSGGIDSSIIVATMSEASASAVKTFSVGFEEESFSELSYARQVAERYHTDHHEFILTYRDLPEVVQHLTTHLGEPLADPSAVPLFYLSRLTREYVTVALNGDGGDEAFAGYQRYWLDPWANYYSRLPSLVIKNIVPGVVSRLSEQMDRPVGGSWVNGLKRLQQIPQIDPRASILRWGSYFSPKLTNQLWREGILVKGEKSAESYLAARFDEAPAVSYLDRTLYTDIVTYLPGDLLVKADRMTMASALEGRSPFLDYEIVEWAARLPERMKVRGLTGKYLLRKAFNDELPDIVRKRGKQGFGIPIGMWLRGSLSSWASDILCGSQSPLNDWFNQKMVEKLFNEHITGRADHGKRLWALVLLGYWVKTLSS
jgi:asparagine synthase (glutamine-hydrolysing)